jgi:para-nitrobenzyl esterase
VSVGLLMTSPLARGLFQRAILESGSVPLRLKSRADLERVGVDLQHKLGVADGPDVLERLRAVKAEELLARGAGDDALPGLSVRNLLCVDGVVLPEQPSAVLAAGRQALVPMIAGSNRDEGTLWSRRLPVDTVPKWRAMLRLICGDLADRAAALYPVNSAADLPAALDALIGDPFVAGARRMVRWQETRVRDTYLYHFTRYGEVSRRSGLGVFHAAELPYVFGTFGALLPTAPEDQQLSAAIMGYWTRFARSGDPNGEGAVPWPAYTAARDEHLQLDLAPQVGRGLKQARCDFWDELQARREGRGRD